DFPVTGLQTCALPILTTAERAAQCTIASGYIATRQSSYEYPQMQAYVARHPEYLVARDQLQYAYGKAMSPAFQRVREVLKRALDDATAGRMTPRQALDGAQRQLEMQLRQWLQGN